MTSNANIDSAQVLFLTSSYRDKLRIHPTCLQPYPVIAGFHTVAVI